MPRHEEPTRSDLAEIEREWPVIAAEVEVVDADCRLASCPGDAIAVRARRRAVNALLAALVQHTNHDGLEPLRSAYLRSTSAATHDSAA